MKFTVNTKALKNVTSLGIIKANITKFFYRSNIVQITATQDTLKLNIEAVGIKTRMTLGGSGDTDTTASVMVDCSTFKSLIDSIDTDILTIEFIDNGIYIHAGTSKFAIPQMIDVNDVQLNEPDDQYNATSSTITINPADWQFIKDHQMYAIATKEAHPVYKNVWVGTDKNVLIGDYDSSLFTHSKRGEFDSICLLPTSLINLFTSIPDGSTITKSDRNYILMIATDNYSMVTEFTPKYEDDESVGSYNSEMILNMLSHPDTFITLDIGPITKFINQAALLNQSDLDKVIDFTVEQGTLTMKNKASSYSMSVDTDDSYKIKFSSDLLKSVLSNLDSTQISIAPMRRGDITIGCIFWTENLTTLLAGMG